MNDTTLNFKMTSNVPRIYKLSKNVTDSDTDIRHKMQFISARNLNIYVFYCFQELNGDWRKNLSGFFAMAVQTLALANTVKRSSGYDGTSENIDQ